MANKKLLQLTQKTVVALTDKIPVQDATGVQELQNATVQQLIDLVPVPDVQTLQTDVAALQTAVTNKIDTDAIAIDFSAIDDTKIPTVKAVADRIATIPTGGMAKFSADAYFTSGTGTPLVQNGKIYGLVDDVTGEDVIYSEATALTNGTAITDAQVDGVMLRKSGTKYYKRVVAGAVKAQWYLKPGTPDTIVGGISQNAVKLQKALNFIKNNGGGTLEFWDGDYTVTPTAAQTWSLKPDSNTQIRGYNGARLICGTTGLGSYKMIYVTGVNNVVVKGLKIVGDRDTNPGDGSFYPDGTTYYGGEGGMGIYVEGSTRVVLQDLKIGKTWGDGIYVGNFLCKHILVDNCYVDNVRRNGMTVTYVDGMVISNSFFINTKGIPPENGIDIETNAGTSVQNVLLANLILTNNNSDGLGIAGSRIQMVNVRSMYNTLRGLSISGQGVTHDQQWEYDISNCVFAANGGSGVELLGGGGRVNIGKCRIEGNGGLVDFAVTGVTTSPAINATYNINGLEFTVKATNITAGAGTISALCTGATGANLPLSGKMARKGIITFAVWGITDAPIPNEVYNINGVQLFVEKVALTGTAGTMQMQLGSSNGSTMPASGEIYRVIGEHQRSFNYDSFSYDTAGDSLISYTSFTTKNDFCGIRWNTKGPVKIDGCDILNNAGRGLFSDIYNSEEVIVTGSTIAGNTGGIVFNNSKGIFSNNSVYNNGGRVNNIEQPSEGAVTINANHFTLTGNNVYRNAFTGIFIWGNGNTILGNAVYGNSQAEHGAYNNIMLGPEASNNIVQTNNFDKLGGRITLTVSGMSDSIIAQAAVGIEGAIYTLGSMPVQVVQTNLTGTSPNISGTIIVEPTGIATSDIPSSGTITRVQGTGPNTITYTAYTVLQPAYGLQFRNGAGSNNLVGNNGTIGRMGVAGDVRDDNTGNIHLAAPDGTRNNFDIGGALGLPSRVVSANGTMDALKDSIILLDATAGSFTFTLSIATDANGRLYELQRIDDNTDAVVTIATEGGGHYIDESGKTTYLLYAQNSCATSKVSLYSVDPNWRIISAYTKPDVPSDLPYAATTNIDFNADKIRTLTLSGNVTLTTSNKVAGREKIIRLIAGAADRTLSFPAGWKWIGNTMPATIVNGKTAILSLYCFGPNDTDIIATYSIEPDLA